MSKKPIAVLISDVHFSLSTLELADKAFRTAIDKAAELGVPLIDCGDLTNDKAIIRAEVANRLLKTMDYAFNKQVFVYLLVGNHSLVNEKGKEHALNFLECFNVNIIDSPTSRAVDVGGIYRDFHFIPYQSSNEEFVKTLKTMHPGDLVIAHQGFKGAHMGDYIQDNSSVDPKDCEGYRIFSGHYHKHQTLGNITYVGNPYTLSFGEANDGPKGFLVLFDDGSFEREILDLRRHVILEGTVHQDRVFLEDQPGINMSDIVWFKLRGLKAELAKLDKKGLSNYVIGHTNFRLDLLPTDTPSSTKASDLEKLTDPQIFDKLLDTSSPEQSEDLKKLWREVYESN